MTDRIIKDTKRVRDYGEVFTPKWVVEKMLDQPEVDAKVRSLTATFLEPSAGEGAFLTEVLARKMKYTLEKSKNAREFGNNALMALSSLYGIELLEDNVEMLVINMHDTFSKIYRTFINNVYGSVPDERVFYSAKTIICANMAQGDALKKTDAAGNPIIFSEWKPVGKTKVQRTEYTFESILDGSGPTGTVKDKYEQLDLFTLDGEPYCEIDSEPSHRHYRLSLWTDVYRQLVS